jgi:ParB-like chromosome segregation protein Spo0J
MPQTNFGRDLGIQLIDPNKIRLADDQITPSKPFRNPRTNLDTEEMANKRESIRTLGMLKAPLVRPLEDDPDYTHQMIAGSLRLRCVLKLIDDDSQCYNSELAEMQPASQVYKTLRCQVRECDEDTSIRISIAENLEHTQVPELDLMEYCQELIQLMDGDKPKYTRAQVAGLVNRGEPWVSLTLQLNDLPAPYKKLMRENRLSRTGAISMVLGAKKENYETVIEKCKEVVREEAEVEAVEAEEEERNALIDLEDAEIDMGLHEMRKDESAVETAKKRVKSASKRVSSASDKKVSAVKKAEEGVITSSTVHKVIMSIPGAKKGAAKPLPAKIIREMHARFESEGTDDEPPVENLVRRVAMRVMEIVLGKHPVDSTQSLKSLLRELENSEKPIEIDE